MTENAGSTFLRPISDASLDDFITRWEEAFGGPISRAEASAKAIQLLELYRVLMRRPASSRSETPIAPETPEAT